MKADSKVILITLLLLGLITSACSKAQKSLDVNPSPIPKPSSMPVLYPTPLPSATPKPRPTMISTTLECSDIAQALKVGGKAWTEFLESSIGAPIQFTGYIFEIDTEKNLISIYSDECDLEIWLKGIPHSSVIYLSYTQIVNGFGTIEDYPDQIYLDEVLVNVDLSTLEIQ